MMTNTVPMALSLAKFGRSLEEKNFYFVFVLLLFFGSVLFSIPLSQIFVFRFLRCIHYFLTEVMFFKEKPCRDVSISLPDLY